MTVKADRLTKKWIRNASDELAVANGCRFDLERAEHAVAWIQDTCVLYEGELAGEPLMLEDWQLDATMRLFGWVRPSKKWRRDVRRFRQASIWIPKKNGKSPTLAAWGLYLLAGDGEPGQKVYLAAKDGAQARTIGGKHAVEMVKRSPLLREPTCHINGTTFQITHLPTSSTMAPISSGNERHQNAKEGLNGSVLIDETHVVDREFVSIISRAGISRSEPLQIEVSTAGNNPEGYGKSRFDLAMAVIEGRQQVDNLLAIVYAAPQDVTPEQIAKNPLKYGKLANPAWERLIDPEEYLADYEQSKSSIPEMLKFMMYRLNVWQASASPWLKPGDWSACCERYTQDDLLGSVAYGGLDLAWVNDFASLVLLFPQENGEYRSLVWFWLPEETARERSHLASYLDWANAGHIRLLPGKTLDKAAIVADLIDIFRLFQVRSFAYDPYKAEDVRIEIENATGSQAFSFGQTIKNFATPTAAFERLVIDRKFKHNGHPVMAWQANHTQVYRDPNGGMRPTRKDKDDHLTIDSIIAVVQATAMAQSQEHEGASVYETRGVLAF